MRKMKKMKYEKANVEEKRKILQDVMKKVTSLATMAVMIVVMAFSSVGLSGCSKSVSAKQPVDLTVYYVTKEANYQQILSFYSKLNQDVNLNFVTFDSEAEMSDRLAAEMANGTGPDVVLFSGASTLDIYIAEKSGNFADLTKYMQQDSDYNSDNYFTNIIEGARVDGKQYILPFYFDLDMYGIRKTVSDDTDVKTLDGIKDYDAFLKTISTQLDQMKAGDNKSIMPVNLNWNVDNINCCMRALGMNLIDEKGNKTFSDADFKMAMKVIKQMYEIYGDDTKNLRLHGPEMLTNANSYLFFGNTLLTVSLLQSITKDQNDELLFCGVPSTSKPSTNQATLSYFGAANSNSKHIDVCYKLLKYVMSYQDQGMPYASLPVLKSAYNKMENYIKSGYGSYSLTNSKTTMIPKWTDSQEQYYNDMINGVTAVSAPNSGIEKIILDTMGDYFKGTAGFDDCYKKLNEKLTLYLQE